MEADAEYKRNINEAEEKRATALAGTYEAAEVDIREKLAALVGALRLFPEEHVFDSDTTQAVKHISDNVGISVTDKSTDSKKRKTYSKDDKKQLLTEFLAGLKDGEKFLLKPLQDKVQTKFGEISGSVDQFLGLEKSPLVKKTEEKPENSRAFYWVKVAVKDGESNG